MTWLLLYLNLRLSFYSPEENIQKSIQNNASFFSYIFSGLISFTFCQTITSGNIFWKQIISLPQTLLIDQNNKYSNVPYTHKNLFRPSVHFNLFHELHRCITTFLWNSNYSPRVNHQTHASVFDILRWTRYVAPKFPSRWYPISSMAGAPTNQRPWSKSQ